MLSEEERALKCAIEELESIADGALPPELAKEEAKALLNLIKEQQRQIKKQQKEIEREKQYSDLYKDLCDKQKKEIKRLKEIEQAHQEENGKLRVELEKEKNKNKVIEIFRKDMPKDTAIICMRKKDFEKKFKGDYISKNKIRKKINECRKLLYCYEKDLYVDKGSMSCIIAQISILQSLLEEE